MHPLGHENVIIDLARNVLAMLFVAGRRVAATFDLVLSSPTRTSRHGTRDSDAEPGGLHRGPCPFVLVAHGPHGRWDVYAEVFDTPVRSFEERQAACDYASKLARSDVNTMVLIRDQYR